MSDNWQDSPIMKAAAFEGMAENRARHLGERFEFALQAIRHLHEHIDALEEWKREQLAEQAECTCSAFTHAVYCASAGPGAKEVARGGRLDIAAGRTEREPS